MSERFYLEAGPGSARSRGAGTLPVPKTDGIKQDEETKNGTGGPVRPSSLHPRAQVTRRANSRFFFRTSGSDSRYYTAQQREPVGPEKIPRELFGIFPGHNHWLSPS